MVLKIWFKLLFISVTLALPLSARPFKKRGKKEYSKQEQPVIENTQKPSTQEVIKKNDVFVPQKKMHVRVLLDQKKHEDGPLWSIQSQTPLDVMCVNQGKKEKILSSKELKFSIRYGRIHVNNKRCSSPRVDVIAFSKDGITFNGNCYLGSFSVVLYEKNINLINILDIEDYVSCVLRSESWPGWPLEVNKVLAVACRTYVVAKILEGKKQRKRLPYHIKNTNIHQTYNGTHTFTSLRQAAQETAGIIMTYEKQPIVAMFDACCGGIVTAGMDDVNFDRGPYLKRSYACTHCSKCSLFQYKSEYTQKELERLLQAHGIHVGRLQDMKVVEKDKAGVVKRVKVQGNKHTEILSKQKVYSLCKKIKSFAFDIHKTGNIFIFSGKGFGHHLGLCQWGAKAMVDKKYHFKDILKFYYPGIEFMKVTY